MEMSMQNFWKTEFTFLPVCSSDRFPSPKYRLKIPYMEIKTSFMEIVRWEENRGKIGLGVL